MIKNHSVTESFVRLEWRYFLHNLLSFLLVLCQVNQPVLSLNICRFKMEFCIPTFLQIFVILHVFDI